MGKQYCTAAARYEQSEMVLDFKTIKGICDYGHEKGMSDDSIGQAIVICNEYVSHKQKQNSGIAETLETIKEIENNIISFKELTDEFLAFREKVKKRDAVQNEIELNDTFIKSIEKINNQLQEMEEDHNSNDLKERLDDIEINIRTNNKRAIEKPELEVYNIYKPDRKEWRRKPAMLTPYEKG